METKEIIQALKCCHNLDECDDCEYNELGGFCEELLKRDAAERLEKLEAELEKRTINDRPYEWISMKDRVPENGVAVLVCRKKERGMTVCTFIDPVSPESIFSHWMPLPEPPKPKEPPFKDVFLKAFPKAPLGYDGAIKVCARNLFSQINCSLSDGCVECWNQPYFDEEGEGDA